MTRPPGALVAVVAAAVITGWAWALFIPGGQAPDEPAHIAYAQVLAERLGTPAPDQIDSDAREQAFSEEQREARDASHQQWQFAQPTVKSEWDRERERRWERAQETHIRWNGGGPNSASGNPPLYYAWVDVAYKITGGHFFDRLFAMRMWSVVLLGAAVAGTWLLIGELTARDRLAQLVGAGVVGLQPMASFISASINPDAMLIPLWAFAFWLGVRLLRGPPRKRELAGLLAVTAAALLAKASSLALLPAVGFVLVTVARRALRERGPAARRTLVGLGVAAGLVLAAGAIGAAGRVTGRFAFGVRDLPAFISYLWQAYLPNLPWQDPLPGLAAFAGYEIWIVTGWAAFGWLEIQFPDAVYVLLALISVGLVAGGLWAIWRRRFPIERPVLWFLGLAAVTLVVILHVAEYRQLITDQGTFMQGRYFLPLLPLGGVLTVAALSLVPATRRALAAAVVLGGLLVLQIFSLGLVAARFYV